MSAPHTYVPGAIGCAACGGQRQSPAHEPASDPDHFPPEERARIEAFLRHEPASAPSPEEMPQEILDFVAVTPETAEERRAMAEGIWLMIGGAIAGERRRAATRERALEADATASFAASRSLHDAVWRVAKAHGWPEGSGPSVPFIENRLAELTAEVERLRAEVVDRNHRIRDVEQERDGALLRARLLSEAAQREPR